MVACVFSPTKIVCVIHISLEGRSERTVSSEIVVAASKIAVGRLYTRVVPLVEAGYGLRTGSSAVR